MIDTAEILARTNLPSLIGETVRLKKVSGKRWLGSCPIHNEKSASFYVFEADASDGAHFHCYGCGAHGDAFDWMKENHGLEFKEAAADLARRAGLDLTKPQAPQIRAPKRPRFPLPDREPATPWGGQHLMASDGRPVYVLNDFPGRRRYTELAERHPGIDLIWYPAPHARADAMYLAPIALRPVRTEPWPTLWEAYRAAALLDAIASWRLRFKGTISDRIHDDLIIEAMRVEGWGEDFMQGRQIIPGIDDETGETAAAEPGRLRSAQHDGTHNSAPDPGLAEVTNDTGHAAAA